MTNQQKNWEELTSPTHVHNAMQDQCTKCNFKDSWEIDFSNRYDLFRGNKDMMLDFIRQVHDEAYERGKKEVLDAIPEKQVIPKLHEYCLIKGCNCHTIKRRNHAIDEIHNNLK